MKWIIFIGWIFLVANFNARAAEPCMYNLDRDSVKLTWEGYKFSEKYKTGVKGTFKDIDYSVKPSRSIADLISSMKFDIKTAKISSGNIVRDPRIYKNFFKIMKNGETIAGRGLSFDGKNKIATIEIEMNENKAPIQFQSEFKGQSFTLKGRIDVVKDFKMLESFAKISEICKALHTHAKDNIAKTWPEVDIVIEGRLQTKGSCPK